MSITLAITSCNRLDLLKQTLESFIKYNTYPIDQMIIRDDSGLMCIGYKLEKLLIEMSLPFDYLIMTGQKVGQLRSIDLIYERIKTDYIFHCEDDWLFYKLGFIEKSLNILETNDKILQVWIRPKEDKIGHNIGSKLNGYNLVKIEKYCNGFSFNPHLCRKSDYIKPYSEIGKENDIGLFYKNLGFRTAWLTEGYVKHNGWGKGCNVEKKYKA